VPVAKVAWHVLRVGTYLIAGMKILVTGANGFIGRDMLARLRAQPGVRRFVFVSSIKVNGEATAAGQAFTADDVPAPSDAYGVSKWDAEQGLWAIARSTRMEVVVVRPPLVYGPGVKANFAALMGAACRRWPLPSSLGRRGMAQRLCGNLQLDNAKAQLLLGWRPPITTDEALRRIVDSMVAR